MQVSKSVISIAIVLLLVLNAFGQEERVKIVKIIDTNLFQLADGRLIQLDEIATPSITSQSTFKKYLAKQILKYTRMMLLGKQVIIQYDSSQVRAGVPLKVHLFKIYPLEKLNINKIYLERGYGKFVPREDFPKEKAYAEAEKTAKQKHLGIWRHKKNIPEIIRKEYLLYYKGGNKNILGDEFRVIGVHAFTESSNSLADFRLGFVRNAEKGETCIDCRDRYYWEEYVHHYGSGYLQIILGKKYKQITIAIGAFGYISGSKYYSYVHYSQIGLSPVLRFRYLFKNGYYIKAALTDDYGFVYPDYPVELALGKWFNRYPLHFWAGLVKSRTRFHAVGGLTYDFGPYSINADFGYGLNTQSLIGELQLGFSLD